MSVTWNDDEARRLFTSAEMRAVLDRASFIITAHAVPHSGVDTGRLTQSMGHEVSLSEDGKHLVANLGSGLGDGSNPVSYWSYHWAGREAPNQSSLAKETDRLPSRPHTTRPAPTKPYVNAMSELGIQYEIEPGGFEA